MTDEQIIEILRGLESDFAQSLVSQYDARFGRLTNKQWYYAEKLATESQTPATVSVLDSQAIFEIFNKTAEKLKYPKIRLEFNGNPLKLSRAGNGSKFPGSIAVTDGGPFGNNQYYGRITEGKWNPSRNCPEWVTDWLRDFSANPAETTAAYGRLSGNCCFCSLPLTDTKSLTVGYGPVCAANWGLPWGSKK